MRGSFLAAAMLIVLLVSCKKESNESYVIAQLDTTSNVSTQDFRDIYTGTYICKEYYTSVHQDSAGNLYWTTDLLDSAKSVIIGLESDSDLSVTIDMGYYYAYYSDTNSYSITNGSVNFFNSGDSLSIYMGSGAMNSYKYQGNKDSI